MTMVFKEVMPGHRTRCREEEMILAIKSDNSRVLHYQKVANHKKFDFPLVKHLFSSCGRVSSKYIIFLELFQK